MKKASLLLVLAAMAAAALLILHGAESAAVRDDRLFRHRNLGRAFYEHPTGSAQAVEEFRQALELAPDSFRERLNYGLALLKAGKAKEGVAELEKAQKQAPNVPHTWFNLGIAFKREGRYPIAIAQFERMTQLVPDEPVSHYNLGLLYNLTERPDLGLEQFTIAAKLDPRLVAPTFQIYNTYRIAGKQQEAASALAVFQETRKAQQEAGESEDMEWSFYSEIYDPVDPSYAVEDAVNNVEPRFQARRLPGTLDPKSAGLAVTDVEGDGRTDLLAWSRSSVRIYRAGVQPVDSSGLAGLTGVISVAPGDFDNDGLQDLCALTETGPVLFHNLKGKYVRMEARLPALRFEKAVWLDFDHDNDLDLLLLGEKSYLMRNEGQAGFNDRTSPFPFFPGRVADAAVLRVTADGKGQDLVVSYTDRSGVLYRDMLRGQFAAQPFDTLPAGATGLRAYDVDNDGRMDLAFAASGKIGLLTNKRGKFEAASTPAASGSAFLFADLENRALGDLVAGNSIYLNLGGGRFGEARVPSGFPSAVAWAEADFDLNGRIDLAAVASDGGVHLLRNVTSTSNRWLRVTLTGTKNLRLAPGAVVEVKNGVRYQRKIYEGLPLLFGMRSYGQADTVRITWPDGMIQNEPNQPVGKSLAYREAPKLSGSCPMVFTWNGKQFKFLMDVLGVAPLGASAGDGEYFPVDNDEYIQIPPEDLALAGGRYQIRVTEELHEVSYLDQVRLIAVDHPAGIDVFTNDKFKAPPFPEFRLFGVTRRTYPTVARDDQGKDVLPRLLRRDHAYPDTFQRDLRGVAAMHSLELGFTPGAARENRAVLILNGWVDWADGSTFMAAAQEGQGGFRLPYLQVKDAKGEWKTVIEDMGIPAGQPRTIAVDLTGKFLSASREIRIVTNLCVYWDEIFLSEETGAPQVRMTPVDPESATLQFRGFSEPILHPERRQPESYDYAHVLLATSWNPVAGFYTRFGDVRELLLGADDRLVVMGSGDELKLAFNAAALPALPAGWRRDFLVLFDGWSKDADANTAHAESVEPLPFHGMSRYPYPPGERFPSDPVHQAYRREYNTRPPLRLIPPLMSSAF